MRPLILPQINLNGTSRNQLVEQQCDVMTALRALYKAMGEAAPNGRDYQFRPAEFTTARDAWDERMTAVELMRREIEAHAIAIQESK
jgi:hypothetical protein